ncbi:MAG: hypothetical protein AABZ47_13385 [Planctomycetota bacterium]
MASDETMKSDGSESSDQNECELLTLAREHFERVAKKKVEWKDGLTDPEKELIRKTAVGEWADYSDKHRDKPNPKDAEKWPDSAVLRAGVIAWLCKDKKANGEIPCDGIRIKGARVKGELELNDALALFPLAFEQCRLMDNLVLLRAHVRTLAFDGSHVSSIRADALRVDAGLFLRNGFTATGAVNLTGAEIGGQLNCIGAKFPQVVEGPITALVADSARIKGSVFFRSRDCGEKTEIHRSINFENATVDDCFQWIDVECSSSAALSLQFAKVGVLWDDAKSWPSPGNLHLHGFKCDEIFEKAPTNAHQRLEWIRRQRKETPQGYIRILSGNDGNDEPYEFNPQPYEQLAMVLREQGHVDDAREILIAKENDRDRHREISWLWRSWRFTIKHTMSYGYEPWRCTKYVLCILILGASLFQMGDAMGVILPTNDRAFVPSRESATRSISPDYPDFNAFFYSLDEFVPLVNLRQGDFWIPNFNQDVLTGKGFGAWVCYFYALFLRVYLWVHILAGWTLTTLFVGGLTGLIRR